MKEMNQHRHRLQGNNRMMLIQLVLVEEEYFDRKQDEQCLENVLIRNHYEPFEG